MSWNRPVSVGEPIGNRTRNAHWFNHTLKGSLPGKKGDSGRYGPKNILVGHVEEGTAERFEVLGVSDVVDQDNHNAFLPILREDALTHTNWVVLQEEAVVGKTVKIILSGLSRAQVDVTDSTHPCVMWNGTELKSSKEGKAQLLVQGDSSTPSLIHIGIQADMIRVTGMAQGAITANLGPFTVDGLSGINTINILSTISAYNPHLFEADDNALVRAEYHCENARWEIYQVTCPAA